MTKEIHRSEVDELVSAVGWLRGVKDVEINWTFMIKLATHPVCRPIQCE